MGVECFLSGVECPGTCYMHEKSQLSDLLVLRVQDIAQTIIQNGINVQIEDVLSDSDVLNTLFSQLDLTNEALHSCQFALLGEINMKDWE